MTLVIATDRPVLQNREKITRTIAHFWNTISAGWASIWGPHIHHGYYEANQVLPPIKAQERLIEKLTELLTQAPQKILDVGCGMGGSSLYLAEHYQADVVGVTLSDQQVNIATARAKASGVTKVHFKVEDALSLASIPDASVDLVWSLESCEQFYDKNLFLQQVQRVLKPGGYLMLATWCSSAAIYQDRQAQKYKKLCAAFDVPYMPTLLHYTELLRQNHFRVETVLDWSRAVAPSWDIGVSLVSMYSFLKLLKMGGLRGLRFAHQIKMMRDAFHEGRVCYGVFIAEKISVVVLFI